MSCIPTKLLGRTLLILVGLLWHFSVLAKIVITQDDFDQISLHDKADVYIATGKSPRLNQFGLPDSSLFSAVESKGPEVYAGPFADVWYRIEVSNTTALDHRYILEVASGDIKKATLFTEQMSDGRLESQVMTKSSAQSDQKFRAIEGYSAEVLGLAVPRNQQKITNEHVLYQLSARSGETKTWYLNLQHDWQLVAPIRLHSQRSHSASVRWISSRNAFFIGFGLALLLFNLALYYQTRDLSYLSYSSVILSYLFYRLYYEGVGQNLTSDWVNWNLVAVDIGRLLYVASAVWFAAVYLKLEEVSLLWRRVTDGLSLFFVGLACWSLTGFKAGYFLNLLVTMAPIYMLITATVRVWQGYYPARIFFVAILLPVLSAIVYNLSDIGFIAPVENITLYSGIAAMSALVLFSIGLGLRIRLLQQEKQMAEELNFQVNAQAAAKSEFLAKMSHEIRTPMNGVLGMAQLLESTELDEKQKRYNNIIKSSAQILLQIINDLLDFSKMDAGKIQLEHIDMDLVLLLNEVKDMFTVQIDERPIEVEIYMAPGTRRYVKGDPIRLKQILTNLMSNALKFTHSGSIKISACETETVNGPCFEVRVIDTGIGIDPGQKESLFQAFTQASESTTRKFGGTGLGLTICKDLVALMGGTIDVISALGEGSTFIVQIPLSFSNDNSVYSGSEAVPADEILDVLVVEDNQVNQLVIERILNEMNHRVTLIDNGLDALNAFVSRNNNFDVVFMDCELPEMDGFEAARRMRKFEMAQGSDRTPIIALSALSVSLDEERYIKSGIDQFMQKPVQRQKIKDCLKRIRPHSNSSEP
jgi:signal transduction histidine kinase/CheY-like chemotaxis protein